MNFHLLKENGVIKFNQDHADESLLDQMALGYIVSICMTNSSPIPDSRSILSYYDSCLAEILPACVVRIERDFFGLHTYERVDKPRGEFFIPSGSNGNSKYTGQ